MKLKKKQKTLKERKCIKSKWKIMINRDNKFYMTLKDDENEKEGAVKEIRDFLKDHYYGKRIKRSNLSLMIRKS